MSDEAPPPDHPPASETPSLGKRHASTGQWRITQDIYEEMAQTYIKLKDRTIRGLSRATGMPMKTCRRAVVLGWPDRGWPPLRERALLHDKREEQRNAEPLSPQQVLDAQRFMEMRNENLNLARAMRALSLQMARRIQEALARATANRTARRTRVITVKQGKRDVQRVITEDVEIPPYLPAIASAAKDAATMAFAAGEAERIWARVEVPDNVEPGIGWDQLTDKQIDEIIANEGKLPAGITIQQLRGGASG